MYAIRSYYAIAVLWALLPQSGPVTLALGLAAPWGFGWHMLWQMRRLDIDNPDVCLRLFRASRDTGLIAALFLAIAAIVYRITSYNVCYTKLLRICSTSTT